MKDIERETVIFGAFMLAIACFLVTISFLLKMGDEVAKREVECAHAKAVLEFAEGKTEYFPPLEE